MEFFLKFSLNFKHTIVRIIRFWMFDHVNRVYRIVYFICVYIIC